VNARLDRATGLRVALAAMTEFATISREAQHHRPNPPADGVRAELPDRRGTPCSPRRGVFVGLSAIHAIAAAFAAAAVMAAEPLSPQPATGPRVLVFTKTAGFRHTSIPVAVQTVRLLGARHGFAVDVTQDASAFTDASLGRYDAVVFLMTTGDVLDARQQLAFQRYIRAGGGFAGIHAASDTEHGWPWFGRLVGAYFKNHPQIQPATIRVDNARDPSTVGLPRRWTRTDEWYNFARNPRGSVRVLATLDERSYSPGADAMGSDHPIAWSHAYQGGRAWYTGGGHTEDAYTEPLFRRHLLGGIRFAAGLTPPRITSVVSSVRARRLVVGVRYTSCQPCAGALQLRVRGRSSRLPIGLRQGSGRLRSPRLPPGHWRYSVVLEDPVTGLTHAVRRSVRIP
jgi:type 1 glutamine amidotransferase